MSLFKDHFSLNPIILKYKNKKINYNEYIIEKNK